MKKVVKVLVVILAVVLLIGASSCFVVTQQDEYTIIRQFGKVVDIRDEAGISLKIPFIQEQSTLPKNVLLYDLPVSDVITKDKKTMVADSFILWRISDPQKFIQTLNSSVSNAESRLSTLVYNSMKNTISGKIAKKVFKEMWTNPDAPEKIVKDKGLVQITDTGAIEKAVDAAIAASPKAVEEYKGGKKKALGALVGQVMKATKGKANPQMVNQMLVAKLGN